MERWYQRGDPYYEDSVSQMAIEDQKVGELRGRAENYSDARRWEDFNAKHAYWITHHDECIKVHYDE